VASEAERKTRDTMRSLRPQALVINTHVYYGVIAKFHYTGPTGPDRTRTDPRGPERTGTDFVGDPHGPTEFLGDPGPVGPV